MHKKCMIKSLEEIDRTLTTSESGRREENVLVLI